MSNSKPLKVLVKSPFSTYSGYGHDGFALLRALRDWGCDVYPQPTWVDVPIPKDLLPLFARTLTGPFDLTINHWDPAHLFITREARKMTRVAVAWSMWEFAGGTGPLPCRDCRLKPDTPAHAPGTCPDTTPGPVSGLYPHCDRIEDEEDTEEGVTEEKSGLASRFKWYDLVLGYDEVSLAAFAPFIPGAVHSGVLQGGYEPRLWKPADRDWTGERFQFLMHGQLNRRKQPFIAIESFCKLKEEKGSAFDGARLLLHTSAPGHIFPELNGPLGPKGIKIICDALPQEAIQDMYAASHCLLAPSMGEGKNLPALEFMTTGGVVAATNFGGHTQWLGGDWAYPLDYTLEPIFGHCPWGAQAAQVSVDTLADAMWHIYTHRAEAQHKAQFAQQHIARTCNWNVVLERLFRLIGYQVTGPGPEVMEKALACRRDDEEPASLLLR